MDWQSCNNRNTVIPEQILSEKRKFRNGIFSTALTNEQLEAINESEFVVFDATAHGHLTIQLSDKSILRFNLLHLHPEDAELLVIACLNDKIVLGYDLLRSFVQARICSTLWMPSCTLDLKLMTKCLCPGANIPTGAENAVKALYTIAGKYDFHAAFDEVIMLDADRSEKYFAAFEFIPLGLTDIVISAAQRYQHERSEIVFAAHLDHCDVMESYTLYTGEGIETMFFPDQFFIDVDAEMDILLDGAAKMIKEMVNADD